MANDKDIERMVKEQLIQSEIRKIKDKLRPAVQEELDKYVNTKEFRKSLSRTVRGQLADILSDDWMNYIKPKAWRRMCARAVRSVLK